MAILEIKNLTFRYKRNFIFDDFNLSIEKGDWVTIAGPNGAGKTTLVKLIAGLLKNYSSINILNKKFNHKNEFEIRKEVGFVFDIPDNFFACETVEDELAFSLENMAVAPATIKKKIDEISKALNLTNLLKQNPFELSGGEKQKVAIGCALMLEPRIIILDESLMMIDINERNLVLKLLKKYNKEKKVTIISFTHDLEECKYSNRLIILNEGKIIIDGSLPDVFKEERVMRKIGIEVPFEVELCNKLQLYNLVDNIEFDYGKLVDKIWK